jgi:hypothetical protein
LVTSVEKTNGARQTMAPRPAPSRPVEVLAAFQADVWAPAARVVAAQVLRLDQTEVPLVPEEDVLGRDAELVAPDERPETLQIPGGRAAEPPQAGRHDAVPRRLGQRPGDQGGQRQLGERREVLRAQVPCPGPAAEPVRGRPIAGKGCLFGGEAAHPSPPSWRTLGRNRSEADPVLAPTRWRCDATSSPPRGRHTADFVPGRDSRGVQLVKRFCTDAAWRAYENAPGSAADALVHLGRRYAMPLLRYAVPLARVRGRTLADGEPGSMLVAGSSAQLLHLRRRFFASDASAESLGSCPVHALPRALLARGASDDLILARVARPLAGLVFDRRFLRAPDLVDVWIDARDRERVWRRMNQTTRHAARALLAAGYSWSEARDPAAFERFYDRYYLPFVAARHAELAIVRERPVLRRHFRQGSILWITRDGEEVAGVLQSVDGRVSTHLVVGTRGGDLEARHRGALDATNLFGIELAIRRGLAWVNLGGCLPSPRDGSLAHKRAWGGELRERRDSHHDLLVRWPRFTPRVARFLADAPLIVRDRGGLAALAALPGDGPAEPRLAQRLWRQWRMPGLRQVHVLAEQGWRAWSRGDARPPLGGLRLGAAGSVEDVLASTQDAACPAREAG